MEEQLQSSHRGFRINLTCVVMSLLAVLALSGCTAGAPKSSAPSTQEIRKDSDKLFQEMKQEEREHRQPSKPATH